MTKQRAPRPEPTTGTDYDTYLSPHSKTPEKEALLNLLRLLGWRFDTTRTEWHTPEHWTHQAHGRLEYDTAYRWARIQPESRDGIRAQSILELRRTALGWNGWTTAEEAASTC